MDIKRTELDGVMALKQLDKMFPTTRRIIIFLDEGELPEFPEYYSSEHDAVFGGVTSYHKEDGIRLFEYEGRRLYFLTEAKGTALLKS